MARQQILNQKQLLMNWPDEFVQVLHMTRQQLLAMLLMVLYGQAPVYCTVPEAEQAEQALW